MPHLTKSWAWALLSSVVLARLVAGCASGTMVVEDVGPRPDTNADMGSARDARADTGRPTTCMIAADCDDHDMCNGTEQCVANRCTIGTPVTCADTVPCTTDRCDPGDGTCSHVPDDVICGSSSTR